jgi:hypothetical protein
MRLRQTLAGRTNSCRSGMQPKMRKRHKKELRRRNGANLIWIITAKSVTVSFFFLTCFRIQSVEC